jgi:hypothetical protein
MHIESSCDIVVRTLEFNITFMLLDFLKLGHVKIFSVKRTLVLVSMLMDSILVGPCEAEDSRLHSRRVILLFGI